jgi:hypothetical protein
MKTDKATRILEKMRERDRHTLKRWTPYSGPPDWNFEVLNAPKKELEEMRDERPEVSNG